MKGQDDRARNWPNVSESVRRYHAGPRDTRRRMVSLTNIQVADGYLFHHSVNVAILAGIMGLAKGYNRNQLEELGMGALMFDIGMTRIPKELLNKTSPFTNAEREAMEKHTEEGFNIIRAQHDISLFSAHCAFQHHERFDGSGYPRSLKAMRFMNMRKSSHLRTSMMRLTSPRPHRKTIHADRGDRIFVRSRQYLFRS